MKLNLKKCLFGKKEENFLGHVITKEGIRATPRKGGITIRNELAEDGERGTSIKWQISGIRTFLI